eukprot:m.183789 g.183789  ORF g.183789 m.183789 type:complete len:324 (+) comp24672_c0_seq2:325-1296(+)
MLGRAQRTWVGVAGVTRGRVKPGSVRRVIANMSADAAPEYEWKVPAKVEDLYPVLSGNKFAGTNRPTAGAQKTEALAVGESGLQLYSLATPNGQKVGIMLEELADANAVAYDAHYTSIGGDQFSSGFVAVNPNSKIPILVDTAPTDKGDSINLFESGSIMVYLADKYSAFIPKDARGRAECMNWVMWQMGGQGPITGGGFGHFFAYAPSSLNRDYPVARYGMEVKRMCSVIEGRLEDRKFLCGDEYTIADMICFPWYHGLRSGGYKSSGVTSATFLSTDEYKNLNRWADEIVARPAVVRGLKVCSNGKGKPWLEEAIEDSASK